jgi:hypothetical protein
MGESRELFSDFITFCKCTNNMGSIPESLKRLINDRDIAVCTWWAEHQNLVSIAGLDWKSKKQIDRRDMRLREVPIHHLPRLAVEYPRAGTWVVETSKIRKLWKKRLMEDPQPDHRHKQLPIDLLDWDLLALDIAPNEDAIIYDAVTGELVLVVIRNFCLHLALVKFVDNVVQLAILMKRSIRVRNSLLCYNCAPNLPFS